MERDPAENMQQDSLIVCMQQGESDAVDNITFAPFILIGGECTALVLFDFNFEAKEQIFKERAEEGWTGNGRDWNAVAEVVIAEQFPQLAGELTFDSDAYLFSISGSRTNLAKLGNALKIVFDDEHILRDILFRAKLHD